jgi:hypothetical protein
VAGKLKKSTKIILLHDFLAPDGLGLGFASGGSVPEAKDTKFPVNHERSTL